MAKLFSVRRPRSVAAPPSRGAAAPPPASLPPPEPHGPTPDAAAEAAQGQRARSRLGTIATSWRGVLDPGALMPVRKSLLGE